MFLCAPVFAQASSITGALRTPAGAAVAGATVTARGPARVTAATDSAGAFRLDVPPGVYRIVVTKAGYTSASTTDVVVAPGTSVPLTVTISEQNLTSLRTIGSVTAAGRGGATINTGAATQSYVSGEAFTQVANPQVNDVLQRIPDVVVQKLGTQQDTSIVVGGLQPYETQVLIDGHPIALGQYGVWLSQYFPSYLIGGVETQSGPGNTTPFANIAVGGTVNLQTIDFTKAATAELTSGIDSYGSQYSNAILTGSFKNLSYVAGAGTAGNNGHYFGKKECDMYQYDPAGKLNSPTSAGIVAFCGDFSGSLYSRGQLYKLRYDFSPATALDVNFLGSYGGFSPQGSAWGESYGPSLVEKCLPNSSALVCTNPADAGLVGKTINAFYWFPGTNISNVQQLWSSQFRSSLGSTTLLVRPYIGTISPETYNGTGEGEYPSFFGPAPGAANYPGPPSLGPGVQIPATGLPAPNAFESSTCPVGTITSFQQINSPQNTITSLKGQEECYQFPYSTSEVDKLYGSTFSLVHPIGLGFLDFTYDFHGQNTFAFANAPSNVQVPFSSSRDSTFSLTGMLKPIDSLAVNFGLYTTQWTLAGQQPVFNAAGVAETDSGGNALYTGLQRSVSRFDPHVALAYRPTANWALRAAAGTSETFPFIGDVSGTAAYQPPAFSQYTAGIITQKNPNLQPEYSIAYSLGADHRFGTRSVLSLDLQDTIVHNVFQQITTQETVPAGILGLFIPINVARLEAKLATVKYAYAPRRGFGFNIAATADSSIFSGIPASAYNTTPALPANNVQVCGNAAFTPGLATCDPSLKGYAQFTYTWRNGTFAALGVDYEGKNNAYYQPPFAIADLSLRAPLARNLDFNLSIQNLFNTNSYNYLPAPNLGVPAVGDFSTNGTTIQQGSYSTYLLPAVTRTLRLSFRAHMGR
jgi:outer membrane receptor protein involved in Fe transport